METRWRIELLGGLRAQCGDQTVTHFETRKVAALLACLAFTPGRSYAREILAEQLWPEEEAGATRDRLRQALAALRRVLEPPPVPAGSILIADRIEVSLAAHAVITDVAEMEAEMETATHAAADEGRIRSLRHAIELYRGELLPGCYENWIAPERERLAEAYRDALSRLADLLADSGDLSGAIEYARRAVHADPLREDAHGSLMRLYARAGRIPDALRQYRELERTLREELGITASPAIRAQLLELRAEGAESVERPVSALPVPRFRDSWALEPEGGAVPLESTFYLVRASDADFESALDRRDSIVLVKGARQMGKTSLLARGLQKAREAGAKVVLTDLQKLTAGQMQSADTLFLTLARIMDEQLEMESDFERVWNPQRGWNVNFERFLRREVLGKTDAPVVWGLDEADRLFGYPFSTEVFGLFRSWHNERSLNPGAPWRRLTLAIAYATEAHLFITDLNQSPFNVGTRLTLEDFTLGQVAELNRRYHSPLRNEQEVARCFALVGGNPYLTRRGLHALMTQGLDYAAFEAQADREDGLYSDHLRRLLHSLRQDPPLCEALKVVLHGKACLESESFYRLRSAGVITGLVPQEARLRCGLYQRYLMTHLK